MSTSPDALPADEVAPYVELFNALDQLGSAIHQVRNPPSPAPAAGRARPATPVRPRVLQSTGQRGSKAGDPDHPGRQRRVHPVAGRDMRDVPIPRPTLEPPVDPDGLLLVWAPWSRRWQPFEAPCVLCDQVAPLVVAVGLCRRCAGVYRPPGRS